MTMICPFPFLVIACAAAFVPQNDRPRSKVGPLSFKDSSSSGKDLPAIRPPLSEHRPSGTTRGSSSFPARIATEEWKEWQASFGRNGVTDFLRPDHGWSRVLSLAQRPGGGKGTRRGCRKPSSEAKRTKVLKPNFGFQPNLQACVLSIAT